LNETSGSGTSARRPGGNIASLLTKSASEESWVVRRTADEALARAAEKFAADPATITLEQHEDVLDTWFSSAFLPFTGVQWPSDNPELAKDYPGTLLETGWDILTF
jgi:valyl-tRNA synthetase